MSTSYVDRRVRALFQWKMPFVFAIGVCLSAVGAGCGHAKLSIDPVEREMELARAFISRADDAMAALIGVAPFEYTAIREWALRVAPIGTPKCEVNARIQRLLRGKDSEKLTVKIEDKPEVIVVSLNYQEGDRITRYHLGFHFDAEKRFCRFTLVSTN